jgi:hypothetical protein
LRAASIGRIEMRAYLILIALVFFYDLLFTLPPFLLHFGISADLIYRFFQPVCHEMDARSFHIFGYKLAVCSRCASIYYGLTFGYISFFQIVEEYSNPELDLLRNSVGCSCRRFQCKFPWHRAKHIHITFDHRWIPRSFDGILFCSSVDLTYERIFPKGCLR